MVRKIGGAGSKPKRRTPKRKVVQKNGSLKLPKDFQADIRFSWIPGKAGERMHIGVFDSKTQKLMWSFIVKVPKRDNSHLVCMYEESWPMLGKEKKR